MNGETIAVLETTKGTLTFRFYHEDAPVTCARISQLITEGFYHNLTFHRVIPGFVIQGGDPLGNGTGGSGKKLPAEFNKRKHVRGTLAMARAQDPNSADSQFYIALAAHPHLDEQYTVFGQLIEGDEILDTMTAGDSITSASIRPLTPTLEA